VDKLLKPQDVAVNETRRSRRQRFVADSFRLWSKRKRQVRFTRLQALPFVHFSQRIHNFAGSERRAAVFAGITN
jgi:hypothetical protein